MKVVAFNGSPKNDGNTYRALRMVTDELEKQDICVEIVQVGKQVIRGCVACNWCARNKQDRCVFDDDPVNEWIPKIREADGILLGSPVYFSGINGTLKAFLDRAGYVLSQHPGGLRYKVGAGVVAVRRSGGVAALDQLKHYIDYFEMISPASNYWSAIHGMTPGEVEYDAEGGQIMQVLGRNMAWLMKVIDYGKEVIELPAIEPKVMTNFIR